MLHRFFNSLVRLSTFSLSFILLRDPPEWHNLQNDRFSFCVVKDNKACSGLGDLVVSQSTREFFMSHSLERILVWEYTIPTLIGLRVFDLVSSPVWWEAASNIIYYLEVW